MKNILLLVLLVLFACDAAAGGPSEVRVGAGAAVVHEVGISFASIMLRPVSLLVWEGNAGIGVTYDVGGREGWNGGIGPLLVRDTDEDVGTYLNALIRASYCGSEWCLSFAHISHGASLGIATDKPNSGLNFLYLEYRLR